MTADLLDALGARSGIVCAIGAGGKKTTMLRLAKAHPGRVGVTATTKIPHRTFERIGGVVVVDDGEDASAMLARAGPGRIVGYAGPERGVHDRHGSVDTALVATIHETGGFAATYVKADGARMRLAKAHGPGEPRLVPGTATVLLLVSVRALGRALDGRTVHHPELFALLAGMGEGEPIAPRHLAAVLCHQVAVLQTAGIAAVVPVLNMADDAALLARAEATADLVWRTSPALRRLAITSMLADQPLRRLYER